MRLRDSTISLFSLLPYNVMAKDWSLDAPVNAQEKLSVKSSHIYPADKLTGLQKYINEALERQNALTSPSN